MSFSLDNLHGLILETQEGPSLAETRVRALIPEAIHELCARHPGVRIPRWWTEEKRLGLLVDLGRSDEDILRLVLHLKRVLRDRVGGGLQWRWGYDETLGADPDQREMLRRAWDLEASPL